MSSEIHLNPVQIQTLKSNISETLTNAILHGKFRPGDRLNESALSRQLQVSRAPIREALGELHERGLVVNIPRRGMFVVQLDEAAIHKINRVRLLLEAEALSQCREALTPAGARKLSGLVERMEQHLEARLAFKLDIEFHRTIWSLSGNEYLERHLVGLTSPLFAYSLILRTKAERASMILDTHRPLLDYVLGKDDTAAYEVMRHHLEKGWGEESGLAERIASASGKRKPKGRSRPAIVKATAPAGRARAT